MYVKYFRLVSDTHEEFGPFDLPHLETDKDSVLVHAGDLHVGTRCVEWLATVAPRFAHVVFSLGNHEYYKQSFDKAPNEIRKAVEAAGLTNVSVFDRVGSVVFDNVRFIGATLWTDMNKGDPITQYEVGTKLSDFHVIRNHGGTKKFSTFDCMNEFAKAKNDIMRELETPFEGKSVVVTHHLPSHSSIDPLYANEKYMNGGFASDLDELIMDYKPDYWCHGHTHSSCNYVLFNTHVLCNPRGYYPRDLNGEFDPTLLVNLEYD